MRKSRRNSNITLDEAKLFLNDHYTNLILRNISIGENVKVKKISKFIC